VLFRSPSALGKGDNEVRGSAYIEGPIQSGDSGSYGTIQATVMLGPLKNDDCDTPENTLYVKGKTTQEGNYRHQGDMDQTGDYNQKGDVTHVGDSDHQGDFNVVGCFTVTSPPTCQAQISGDFDLIGSMSATGTIDSNTSMTAPTFYGNLIGNVTGTASGNKAFDIPHPTKEGWRLRHVCLEGPTADVYVRGRITNKNRIELPEYWLGLVDPRSITVSLTPIGAHQDVVIKRISENAVHLQSKGGMPIDCFYHIYGERRDSDKLIHEYQGKTPADYPGNNDQYSIAGYHYDTRG
jgi:hypothetical protein